MQSFHNIIKISIIMILCFASSIYGKPRIALVLGGGGARGAAHIGVLKQLESYFIPIDIIVGTSMGAVVGSLYASGLSPEEIETALQTIDWSKMFIDQSDRQALPYRRKEEDVFYLPNEIGTAKNTLLFTKGLVQGQKFNLTLSHLLGYQAGIKKFNQLNIPISIIATDVERGEPVIIETGDLIDAVRASLSAPGFFEPVEFEGRLLVDGGVTKNVPIDVAKALNADIVIAVTVDPPLRQRDQLATPLDISFQVIDILVRKNIEEQLKLLDKEKDILIEPDLGDITALDFGRIKDMVAPGIIATQQQEIALTKLSLNPRDYEKYLAKQRRRVLANEVNLITEIILDNQSPVDREVILKAISQPIGEPLQLEQLKADIAKLYGYGDFEKIEYRLQQSVQGQQLILKAKGKSWGPNYLRLGGQLETNFLDESLYNIRLQHRFTQLNAWEGEWRNRLQFGDEFRFTSEFYQPLGGNADLFIAPHIDIFSQKIYENNQLDEEIKVDHLTLGLDLGYRLSHWGELRFGLAKTLLEEEGRSERDGIIITLDDIELLYFNVAIDTLDDPFFPSQGWRSQFKYTLAFQDWQEQVYSQAYLDLQTALSKNKHHFIFDIRAGLTLQGSAPLVDQFALGGFHQLSALDKNSLRDENITYAGLWYYRPIMNIANFPLYLGSGIEVGSIWQSKFSESDLKSNFNLFLGTKTFLGALYLNYAFDEEERSSLYFSLGNAF